MKNTGLALKTLLPITPSTWEPPTTNLDEVLKVDPSNVCGIKLFMGSSTGNMLVDNENALKELFSKTPPANYSTL